jgi:hypothetical protein
VKKKLKQVYVVKGQDSLGGIATGYGLDGWGLIPGRGKRFFFSPQRSDWFWG